MFLIEKEELLKTQNYKNNPEIIDLFNQLLKCIEMDIKSLVSVGNDRDIDLIHIILTQL